MSISSCSSDPHPEKRAAEEDLESERQKRLKVVFDMKDLLMRTEAGFDPAALISIIGGDALRFEEPEIRSRLISEIDEFLLLPSPGEKDWNQLLCKMKKTVQEEGKEPETNPPAGRVLNEFEEFLLSCGEDVTMSVSNYSDYKGMLPEKPTPPEYCEFCKQVTKHFPGACPEDALEFLPPPPPTPEQLALYRNYYCDLCKEYTDHGRYSCPISNSVYRPLPDGTIIQIKCEFCREALHPGTLCEFMK